MPSAMRHRRKGGAAVTKRVFPRLVLVAVVASLVGACDSSEPVPPSSVLSIKLEEGVAWLGGNQNGTQLDREQTLDLNWNQTVWAAEDESATLRIGEGGQLWLDPDSGFRVVSSVPPDQRPVMRLLKGHLRYRAMDNHYALGVRFEVPSELRIMVTDLVATPAVDGTELEILIKDDVTTVTVLDGEVAARGNGVSDTLFTDWRAIVRPGEPMEVIPPRPTATPTPTVTPTSTKRPTLAVTFTPAVTATSTLTLTLAAPTLAPSPTSRPRPVATRAPTPVPQPTQPPQPQPPSPPQPTQPPAPQPTQPPPPTEPPPTQPPPTQPPPTEVGRPTPGGS